MSNSLASRISRIPKIFDAARADRTLEYLGARAGDGRASQLIAAIASNSPYLAVVLEREADLLPMLLHGAPEASFRDLMSSLDCPTDLPRHELMRQLRTTKRQVALLIALADSGEAWGLDEVTRSLTELADKTLQVALKSAFFEAASRGRLRAFDEGDPTEHCGLFFLAMGKYGAFELNYSSDIDFSCYFDPSRLPVAGKYEAQEVAVRITQSAVSLMQETTPDGYVFRCDLRLRPDAGSTQIAVSMRAAESYYESMGQNWERAAMIKARVCAGDFVSGQEFQQGLQPFVWRKYLDFAAIEDIHSIKRQIHAHGGHSAIAVAGHNIKLGRGGIREIEFFAQTQQLILGGRISSLRSPRTTDALDSLEARGVITFQTCADLKASYGFLRTLEHRLQMIEDQQTHSMPKSAEGLANIANFMGFESAEQLSAILRDTLAGVQLHYSKLFESQPSLSKPSGSLVFTGVEADPETIQTLRRMGFSQPEAMSTTIRGWHHGRIRATRSERAREKLTTLMPLLLGALGQTANPDIAFTRFDKFLSGLPSGVQVFALLLSNAGLLGLIAEIVGTAPRLADHLAARPGLLDVLIDSEFLRHQPALEELLAGLSELVRSGRRFEEHLDIVRRWTKDQQFRVGLQLLRFEMDGIRAGYAFADVAEAAIRALYDVTLSEMTAAHGQIANGGLVVIGMGRLGGREMSATSDLDLIFVYDHAVDALASNGERALMPSVYYARCAQRLITALTAMTAEGGLFDVDMRLRPSGNKGPVAVSFETFRNYQVSEAWTWERLALTRARVIAGPPELGALVQGVIAKSLTAHRNAEKTLMEVADMRGRLDRERPAKSVWELKEAKGGLFDVEFIVQGLQLTNACRIPSVLNTNTLLAMDELTKAQCLSGADGGVLREALQTYLVLFQILRLTVGDVFDPTDVSNSLRELIVKITDSQSHSILEERLSRLEHGVRDIFERVVGKVSAN
ncbi:MAG: bifunctional [glutamine synthetase] adenylyltransferase/[glutamine synthetase]-adenylyl-L-tyrosine phosphorylase [Micropepsaceae bacterium]